MSNAPNHRPAPGKRRERERSHLDFELAYTEARHLLDALDHGLWKQGLRPGAGETPGSETCDEASGGRARRRATLFAGALTRGLQKRMRDTVEACAELSARERAGLAGLLRLPEPRRQAVTALLRLPPAQRQALAVVFSLPDEECAGLAEFLDATEESVEPTLTIIDPSVLDEPTAVPTQPA
jgi:hypothetical protein